MTRAKDRLELVVPQRFFTHGQRALGDRHIYAARTRYIPDNMLSLFETASWPKAPELDTEARTAVPEVRIDVKFRMREMWS